MDKKLNRRLPTGQRSGRKRLGPPRSDGPSRYAAKRRLPAVYGYREFVDAGGLISYGPDIRAARALGLAISPTLLAQANAVIE